MDAIDNGLYLDKPRLRHSQVQSFTPGTVTPVQVAAGSAKRVRITFISAGPNIMQLNLDNPANPGRFIQLSAQAPIFSLDVADYGSLVQQPWFAISLVGAMGLAVIETVED